MIVSSVLLGLLQQPQSQGTESTVSMEKCFSLGTSLQLPLATVPSVLQRPRRNKDGEGAPSLLRHEPRRQLAARPPAKPSSLWGCHHQRYAARSSPTRGHWGPPSGSARSPLPKVTPTAALMTPHGAAPPPALRSPPPARAAPAPGSTGEGRGCAPPPRSRGLGTAVRARSPQGCLSGSGCFGTAGWRGGGQRICPSFCLPVHPPVPAWAAARGRVCD